MELKKGEVICDVCNGTGVVDNKTEPDSNFRMYLCKVQCPKCKGDKVLDWIETLVGKSEIQTIFWDSEGTATTANNFTPISIDSIEKMYECFGVPKSFFLEECENKEDIEKFKDVLGLNFSKTNEQLKELSKSLEILENERKKKSE